LKYNRLGQDSNQYQWITCFNAEMSHLTCLNVHIFVYIPSFVLIRF